MAHGCRFKSLAERKKALLEFLAEACVYEEDKKENGKQPEEEKKRMKMPCKWNY